jgi:hypothetical protein
VFREKRAFFRRVPAHWSVHRYNYHYEVKHTKGQSYKGMQVLSADIIHDSKRVVIERHGLRIIFEVTGSIGRWDFGELLVNLAAASSVLAIGTLIIEVRTGLSSRFSSRMNAISFAKTGSGRTSGKNTEQSTVSREQMRSNVYCRVAAQSDVGLMTRRSSSNRRNMITTTKAAGRASLVQGSANSKSPCVYSKQWHAIPTTDH